jgi:hypothetical protein
MQRTHPADHVMDGEFIVDGIRFRSRRMSLDSLQNRGRGAIGVDEIHRPSEANPLHVP